MKTNKSKMIQTVISLLIMFVAGYFIPTWGPVTRMGVQYLCIMIGWIYMSIVTGGLLLSSVIALTACVIPGYYTAASIVSTTLGNSITLLMIFIFIMVYIFQKTQTGEFLVRWLLSRKVVNGRPYLFTAFFFIAIIVIGAVIGSFGIILLAIAILDALAEVTGMDKKNDWFRFLLLATVGLSGTTEVFFPFKPYAALYMSIFDAQLNTIGAACDGNTWLITAAIMAVLSFVILMLLARFAFKFDLKRMKELDVSVLQTPEFKKMSKKQVIVLISVILTFFYPSILMLLPKESGVYLFLNNIGQNLFMGFVICLLCLIHVDGERQASLALRLVIFGGEALDPGGGLHLGATDGDAHAGIVMRVRSPQCGHRARTSALRATLGFRFAPPPAYEAATPLTPAGCPAPACTRAR